MDGIRASEVRPPVPKRNIFSKAKKPLPRNWLNWNPKPTSVGENEMILQSLPDICKTKPNSFTAGKDYTILQPMLENGVLVLDDTGESTIVLASRFDLPPISLVLGTVKMKDIEALEQTFATMTSTGGWVIPEWLVAMREQALHPENRLMSTFLNLRCNSR